jgi:aryl-alcohol dehydrogenase-like predicted oxidoreductase
VDAKSKVVLATKAGIIAAHQKPVIGLVIAGRNADEHYFYRAAEASALRLGVSTIKLWQTSPPSHDAI